MDISENVAKPFVGVPEVNFRLRWEIWQNGELQRANSWTPLAVYSFSAERVKYKDNAEIIIAKQSLDGTIEQPMLKVYNADVLRMDYHQLAITKRGQVFAGIIIHTPYGVFNCSVSGEVFEEPVECPKT